MHVTPPPLSWHDLDEDDCDDPGAPNRFGWRTEESEGDFAVEAMAYREVGHEAADWWVRLAEHDDSGVQVGGWYAEGIADSIEDGAKRVREILDLTWQQVKRGRQ